jgi:membrane protein implicated in regulation of membrane protease activity
MGFELSWTWFWVILSALLVVGEIFTAGFFILPFGIGAAVAALFAWAGLGLVWQWAIFLIVSIPSLLLLKRFADRVTEGADLRVAGDRVLDKVGLVLEEVQPHGFTGLVRIGSEEWRAASDGEERIPAGASVEVLRVDGTHLVVRPRSVQPDGGSEGGA